MLSSINDFYISKIHFYIDIIQSINFILDKIIFMKSKYLVVLLCFSMFFLRSQENINNNIDFNGFFNFNYDKKSGKIFLDVDKLNYDFLYINSLTTGLGSNDIGLDRGQLGNERLVRFKKYGNKLLLIQPNLKYRAYTDNKLEIKSVRSFCFFSNFWI